MALSKRSNWVATAGVVVLLASSLAGCSMAEELQNLVGADDGTQDPAEGSNEAGKDPSSKGEPTSEPIEEQTEAPSPSATESPTSNETGPVLEDGALWDCLDLAA